MSEYFTPPADIGAGNRARSAKINNFIQAVEDAFDLLPAGLVAAVNELIAGRDGYDSLLEKQDAQDTLIAALGGDPISLNILSQATLKQHFLL